MLPDYDKVVPFIQEDVYTYIVHEKVCTVHIHMYTMYVHIYVHTMYVNTCGWSLMCGCLAVG